MLAKGDERCNDLASSAEFNSFEFTHSEAHTVVIPYSPLFLEENGASERFIDAIAG